MKRTLSLMLLIAATAILAVPATAQTYSNTMWGQEGTAADGYAPIDPKAENLTGPNGDYTDSLENFVLQYGSSSWSGIYSWDGDAWLTENSVGDGAVDIECDIEMYWSDTIENNKIYFHIGNPFTATSAEKSALVNGTYAANNLMYIGLNFGQYKDIVMDGAFGRVVGGMTGTTDIGGRDISAESFDVLFSCRVNGGAWTTPSNFGSGAHDTIDNTLWWSPADTGMTLGTGTYQFSAMLDVPASQADGNYNLDPAIVVAPVL